MSCISQKKALLGFPGREEPHSEAIPRKEGKEPNSGDRGGGLQIQKLPREKVFL